MDSIISFVKNLQIFNDRTGYARTSLLDYNTTIKTAGGVFLVGLLLEATVFGSPSYLSTMGELQVVTSCKEYV